MKGPLGTRNVALPNIKSSGINRTSSCDVGCLPIGLSFTWFATSKQTVWSSENV